MNKKIIIFLFILSLILGVTGVASARETETGANRGSLNVNVSGQVKTDDQAKITSTINAEIQAAIKRETERCATLKTEDEAKACRAKIETTIRSKFQNAVKEPGLLNNFFRGEGSIDDKNKADGRNDGEKRNGSVTASAHVEGVIARLGAIHERLIKVADRIESRIEKIDSSINTKASVELVTKAREELRLAASATAEASTSFKTENGIAAGKNDVKAAYAKTIAHIKEAKQHLIQAHRNLVQAITNIKPEVRVDVKGTLN
ncbi:MAG TPA: hypothetical protein VK145_01985 [Candidatus Nanoarchaeia archaeon]|nr:hypothetical protein [Candidatus Nanoarchaeia archaeon]